MENKNILVQYRGGGYDGCFWEWNYFYIDKAGEFHDIFSSGRSGIVNQDQALELIAEDKHHTYIYNVGNKKEMLDFVKESNPVNILGVLQWFDKYNDPDVEVKAICSECEQEIDYSDGLSLENWHGCGGIASTADKLLCSECYCLGECECCGEYVGKDNIFYTGGEYNFDDEYKNKAAREMLDDGYSDICSGCLDCKASQIEQDEHGELLFQSLATGEPDMFSDEMSWFWGG